MKTICLNCGHNFKGNFCPECGQQATIKRISAAVLFHDVIHFFTHLEKGFLFTTWQYLLHPGISSINYLAGKRKKFQTPVSYFLIWTGLYILLHNAIVNYFDYHMAGEVLTEIDKSGKANILLQKHFTLIIIPSVLCSALSVYFLLARPKYNFTEVLALSLYGGGTYFMMLFASDIILGFIFRVNVLGSPVFLWQAGLSFIYNFWVSFDIFKRLGLRLFWIRLISASILVAVSGWIILFYLPIVWLYFSKH